MPVRARRRAWRHERQTGRDLEWHSRWAGVCCISVSDVIIKHPSGAHPLHQIVFLRSRIPIVSSLLPAQLEGGLSLLRTWQPGYDMCQKPF